MPPGPFLKHMREHKSRWSHSWSLLLMGMYIVQHTLAFLQHWRIVFFKAVNKFFQILHGKLRRKQKKKTKRLTSSSQLWALFRVKVQTVYQKVWRKKSQNRIRRVHFQIQKSSKIFLHIHFYLDLIINNCIKVQRQTVYQTVWRKK